MTYSEPTAFDEEPDDDIGGGNTGSTKGGSEWTADELEADPEVTDGLVGLDPDFSTGREVRGERG